MTGAPLVSFAEATAVSRIVVPALSVRRKASSSAYATSEIVFQFVSSSGYEAFIASFDAVNRVGIRAERTWSATTRRRTSSS